MITTILIFSLSIYWLMIETDWLRVDLIGALPEIEYQRKPWEELEPRGKITLKKYPFWLCYPEHMAPLCGRDWLENTIHIIPEYKIELNTGGVHYKMNIKSEGILNQVMKVNKLTKAQKLAYI